LGNVQAPARNQNVLDIPETLQLVCSFLDRPTLLAASRVSRAWRACCHPFLWSVIPATAWNNPYLLAHWKQHAPLIQHLSLAGQPSASEHSLLLLIPPPPLLLLHEVSEHCHELVSVDASRITVSGICGGGGNSSSSSNGITPMLCKVLLHNGGQLRSLRLSLQGRIPRDLVYALGNLRVLQELVLDYWTDFDEYSLQRILLDACPPSLVSLSLSDNDFLPFTLESLHTVPAAAAVVVDCPPPLLLQGGGTRSSRTALAAGAAAWASSNHSGDRPKRASDPIFTTTSNSVNDNIMTTDLSTRDHYSSLERDGGQDKRQQQQREPKQQHASYPNNIINSVGSRRHPPKNTNMEMEMGNKVYPHLGSKFNLPPPSSGGGVLHNSLTSDSTPYTKRINTSSVATTTMNITSTTTTTTNIRSLAIHRATFRQGFLLNLLRLCPRLERLSLLESRGFFPTTTFPARLAQLCPRLRDFEFSSPAAAGSHGVDGGRMGRRGGEGGGGGSGQQQPDLTDPFFAALLEQFPQTRHLVVGGSHATSGVVSSSSSGTSSSSVPSTSSSSSSSSSRPIGATGAPTGFSLKAWKQLLQTISPSSALHPHHQHQLVHLTLDGVRGLPSKQLVQVLAQCTSLEHWSAKGLVLNARDVDDPGLRPWACRRLQVFVMDIEIYEMNVGVPFASFVSASSGSVANVSAAAAAVVGGGGGGGGKEGREGGQGGGTGPVLEPRQEQQHGQQQQQHEHNERESVEAVVRQRMYGQLALLGCLVHFGLGGGHGLRRQRQRQRQTQNEGDGGGRKSRQNDSLLLQAEEGIVEEEPGIDLTRRSGVDKWLLVQQPQQQQQHPPQQSQRQQGRQTAWPFLEVLDLTRLCTNPRWHLDEGDEAWIADQFPRLRRILVAKKKKDWPSSPPPPSSLSSSSVLSSMLATSATAAYTLRRQPSSQPQTPPLSPLVPLVEPPQKPDILLPWIRHHRPDIIIDEQS
ncbi:hypothetical protein DFQ27_000170, partial [Actinomortierella ambigua]